MTCLTGFMAAWPRPQIEASVMTRESSLRRLSSHCGCFIGSAAVVVLSGKDDMRAVALNLLRFFEDESCGQCTPCRIGTEKAVHIMEQPRWDETLLNELTKVMTDASICGLGQAAMNPVKQVLKHFRDDLAVAPAPPAAQVPDPGKPARY